MQGDEQTLQKRAYSVPALERGLELIELLASAADGLSQTDIAVRTGRTVSENFRQLVCLEGAGYLRRGPDDRYRLSMKLFTLAHQLPPSRRVIDAALPEMHALSQHARQSCHLGIEDGGDLLIIAQVESPAPVGINVRIGVRHPLATTASGRILLAQKDNAGRTAALLAAGTDPASGAGRLALDRIEKIAQFGFESVVDDTMFGIVDLSRPVFDRYGTCVAALTIPFLTASSRDNAIEAALSDLAAAALRVSLALGHVPEKDLAQ